MLKEIMKFSFPSAFYVCLVHGLLFFKFAMLLLHTNTLMDSVSQLLEIKSDILQPMVNEICEADIPFEAVYADFHSGGWHTALLYATDLHITFR